MKKLDMIIIMLFSLTGCYNYRELNDLGIVSGISIAKVDEGYELTVEVVNTKKETDASTGNETAFVIYKNTSDSLQEGFRRLINEAPKKMYGAQIELLILDESLAREDLKNIVDFLSRDPEVRSEFYVVISKNDEALKIISPLVNLSSKNIVNSLKSTNTYMGFVNLVTYHELLSNFINPHIEIALPSIEMVGNEEVGENTENIETTTSEANNIISNMTVFKDGKMLGYLTEEESLGYNIIMNNSKTVLIRNEYDNGDFIINEIIDSSTEVLPNIKDKEITINIKGGASIAEVNYDINLESDKDIKKIEKKFNNNIEKLVLNTIDSTNNKYNSDIYGFRDLFYKSNPKKYKKLIKELEDDFLNELNIKVKSNIKIIEKGNLNGGIVDEQRESK